MFGVHLHSNELFNFQFQYIFSNYIELNNEAQLVYYEVFIGIFYAGIGPKRMI